MYQGFNSAIYAIECQQVRSYRKYTAFSECLEHFALPHAMYVSLPLNTCVVFSIQTRGSALNNTYVDVDDAIEVDTICTPYAKQKHLGCKKSARPIRSNMQAGRCNQKL